MMYKLSLFLVLAAAWLEPTSARTYGLLSTERDKLLFVPYTPEQRQQVAKQAKDLMSIYVNRESKLTNYGSEFPGIDPIPRVEALNAVARNISDQDLHFNLSTIFRNLRDFHTVYNMPGPYGCFFVTSGIRFNLFEGGSLENPVVGVSAFGTAAAYRKLAPILKNVSIGDTLISVDGLTFPQYVAQTKYENGGANNFGAQRAALYSLQIRNGASRPLPAKDSITFVLKSIKTGQDYTINAPWIAIRQDKCYKDAASLYTTVTGKDVPADSGDLIKDNLAGPELVRPPRNIKTILKTFENPSSRFLEANLPKVRYAGVNYTDTPIDILKYTIYRPEKENLGIIRLESFNPEVADGITTILFIRQLLLEELRDTNAILFDIRSNPGGLIDLADGIPQLFSTKFEPTSARALIAPINDIIFKEYQDGFSGAYLASPRNQKYSTPTPLSNEAQNNLFGMAYLKPVGVFNNGDCYSACDLFSANMQDFEVGPIFGEDGQTGAGGANVVNTNEFFPIVAKDVFPFLPYAQNVTEKSAIPEFTLAWRQTVRAGKNTGALIEDLGIKSDSVVRPTPKDFLQSGELSSQFSRIAAALKAYGDKTGKNNLFFYSVPQFSGASYLESDVSIRFVSQGLTSFEVLSVNNNNKVVGSLTLANNVTARALNTLSFPADVSEPGLGAYTVIGKVGNQIRLKTQRYIRFTPARSQFISVNPATPFSWNFESKRGLGVYNSASTNKTNGWNLVNKKLVLGSGSGNYSANLDTQASIFFRVPKGRTLSVAITATIDTEKGFDFFSAGVSAGDNTIYFTADQATKKDGLSGKTTYDQVVTLQAWNDELEIFVKFTSDGGVSASGVQVTRFDVSVL